jgi:hypothetical protein
VNLYLDIDDNADEYDEDTNPGGTRTVLEEAGVYLHNAAALWDVLGVKDKAKELAALRQRLFDMSSSEHQGEARLEPDELVRLATLLDGLVEAAERGLVDENWRVHPERISEVDQKRPPLGYFTTDADGQRIYTLSRCLSELNMTLAYVRKAINLGCAVLAG